MVEITRDNVTTDDDKDGLYRRRKKQQHVQMTNVPVFQSKVSRLNCDR